MRKVIVMILLLWGCWMVYGQDYLQQATTCFEKGDYECAKRNYTLHQTFDGSNMSALIQKADECYKALIAADAFFNEKDYEKARDRYKSVLEQNPKDLHAKKQYDACEASITINPFLTVSPTSLSVTSVAIETTFTITTNTNWTITFNDVTWFKVSTSSGSGEKTITVSANANTTNYPRKATIIVIGGGITRAIEVTQDGKLSYEPEMVYVQGGTFTMGCTGEQGRDCWSDESPTHQVTLTSFNIGKYEATEGQWQAVMGSNPSINVRGDNYPVENVSWNMIVGTTGNYMDINGIRYYADGFIYKLNQLSGKRYRLPTEAEWEYAARGGNQSKGYKFSGSNTLGNVAWHSSNSSNRKRIVGTKSPNELGICDMNGNVWEWCSDWYASSYDTSNALNNPTGILSGSDRVCRGGSWDSDAQNNRVSLRRNNTPGYCNDLIGFRLVLPL